MEIVCVYQEYRFKYGEAFYRCCIKNQEIPENQELIIIGSHKNGMSNKDVLCIEFNSCIITKIPQGLTKIYPNLKILDIDGSKLRKIFKNDLIEYKNFEKLLFGRNEIEFLSDDLFEGFINLEYIRFFCNKLKLIMPKILDGLNKLKYVDFRNNINYETCFSLYPEYRSNATLEQIKDELFDKFHPYLMQFEDFIKSKNEPVKNLERENQTLKNSEAMLKQQVEQLKNDLKNEKDKNSNLDWGPNEGVFGDIKALLQDETEKDFKIVIGAQEFPVHKFLLAARSPTLAEIFKNNPEAENLSLVDISVEIFDVILKFLYTDKIIEDSGTDFSNLFAAAGKLKIKGVMNYAALMLEGQVTPRNAFEVFKLCNNYEHEELRQKAFDVLNNCYPNFRFKDEWINKPEIVLKAIEYIKKDEEACKLEEEFENPSM